MTNRPDTPNTPKLLPWLARKAGLDDRRAAQLWREAERWAAHRAATATPHYHALAVDRLLELVAAESLREDAASFGWRPWARLQARALAWSMQFAHDGAALNARVWRVLGSGGLGQAC